jgi:phosphoglycolate phosphatase
LVSIRCREVTFSNIEAIIFDKDGTLENSQEYLRHLGYKRSRSIDAQIPGVGEPLLMAFGLDGDRLDPAGLLAVGSTRENLIAAAAYIAETGRGWIESVGIAKKAFEQAEATCGTSATSPLFAGSLEVLELLSEAGLKLGILSAATTAAVRAFVAKHQLEPYIQLQMGVDSELTKPDPVLFLQACQTLNVKPERALMVGDSAGDMEMASQAGAAGCVAIRWHKSIVPDFAKADVQISQLDEIQIL